jgi:hypothetical protein
MRREVWLLLVATVGACGGGGTNPPMNQSSGPFDVATCPGTLRQVYQSAAGELAPNPGDMAWKDGTLYVAHSDTEYSWVFSIPDHGGSKNLLYEGHLRAFWLQGQNLIYAQDYELFDLPRTGGPPTPILHFGDKYYDPSGGNGLFDQVLDDTAIYWLFNYADQLLVWQHLRSGGDDTILAMPSSIAPTERGWMHQAAGQLVLGFSSDVVAPQVLTVPKGGNGTYQTLPIPSATAVPLATTNDGTLLWTDSPRVSGGNFPPTDHTLARQHLDGTAAMPFSTTMQPTAAPLQAYPAGGGAWYVATFEYQAKNPYLTLWTVQSDGTAKRVACDPMPPAPSIYAVAQYPAGNPTAGIAADGAFYLAIVYGDPNHGGSWQVVGVDNAATAPDTGDAGLVPGAPIVDGGADAGVEAGDGSR